jgi:hypothetical protein
MQHSVSKTMKNIIYVITKDWALHSTKGSATGIGRGLQVTIYNSKGSATGIGRDLQVTIYNSKGSATGIHILS